MDRSGARTSPDAIIQKCVDLGINRFVITVIHTDAPDAGPDLAFFKDILTQFPDIHISASGHVRSFADIDDLKEVGVAEVIVGNEIYREPELMEEIFRYNEKAEEEEEE